MVAVEDRVVVQLLPDRCPESRILEIPAVLENSLDDHEIQDRVVAVDERCVEVSLPDLEHDESSEGRQSHRGDHEDDPATLFGDPPSTAHGAAAYCARAASDRCSRDACLSGLEGEV